MATLCTEGSDGFVTSTAAPIATGRSDPVAGRDSHPQDLSTFPRRTYEERLAREGLVVNCSRTAGQPSIRPFSLSWTRMYVMREARSGLTLPAAEQ